LIGTLKVAVAKRSTTLFVTLPTVVLATTAGWMLRTKSLYHVYLCLTSHLCSITATSLADADPKSSKGDVGNAYGFVIASDPDPFGCLSFNRTTLKLVPAIVDEGIVILNETSIDFTEISFPIRCPSLTPWAMSDKPTMYAQVGPDAETIIDVVSNVSICLSSIFLESLLTLVSRVLTLSVVVFCRLAGGAFADMLALLFDICEMSKSFLVWLFIHQNSVFVCIEPEPGLGG